jgi:hypothetical protein
MEALSERVSVLERSQSGAPAFPRPGAKAAGVGAAGPAATASDPTTEPPESPRPAAEVARRPSLGAVRRSKEAVAPAPAAPETTPTAAAPPPAAPPAPAPGATAPPAAAASTGATPTLDRDSLTEAWGDGILQSLPARAKARYASGRFVAVDDQGVHFALPNAAHREQCAETQPVVEKALSDHFGTKVTLVLDIDDAGTPPAAGPGPSPAASGRPGGGNATAQAPPVDEDEYVDPSELIDDTVSDQASAAEARLLHAFPGASEVPE